MWNLNIFLKSSCYWFSSVLEILYNILTKITIKVTRQFSRNFLQYSWFYGLIHARCKRKLNTIMYKVFIISWSISLIYHSDLFFAFVHMHYLGTLITLKYYQLLSISRTKIQSFLEPFWTRVWTQTRNVWTQKDSDSSLKINWVFGRSNCNV